MAPIQDTRAISFVVETLTVNNGRRLGMIRPNEDGYYTVPLAVLGTKTRNNTYYDIPSFVDQLENTDSTINKMVIDGTLFGEYGHPDISLLDNDKALERLMVVNEKLLSHHIRKIYSGQRLEDGGILVLGEVKPHGPYAEALASSLDDPCINTSFSLRSIATSERKQNVIWREIRKLVTFDAVTAGGYQEASKRYSPGVENLDSTANSANNYVEVTINPNVTRLTEVAMERFSRHELNEIFGSKQITLVGKSYTFFSTNNNRSVIDNDGKTRSIYHHLIKGT